MTGVGNCFEIAGVAPVERQFSTGAAGVLVISSSIPIYLIMGGRELRGRLEDA